MKNNQANASTPPNRDKNWVCDFFNISTSTLDKWMREGSIPFYRFGSTVRFSESEVMAFAKSHQAPAESAG